MKEENKNVNKSKTLKYVLGIVTGVLLASSITVNTIQAINISKLKNEIQSSNKEISDLNGLNKQLESSIVILNDEVKCKENRIKTLSIEVEELNKDKETNTATIQSLNAQIEKTKGEIAKLNTEIEKKEKEIDKLNYIIYSSQQAGGGGNSSYSVIYVADGNIVNTINVQSGGSVSTPPTVPDKVGYTGAWSATASNIQANTIINAVYTASTYSLKYDLHFFNENISGQMTAVYTGNDIVLEFTRPVGPANGLELKFRPCATITVNSNSFSFNGVTYTISGNNVNNGSGTPIDISTDNFSDGGYDFTFINSRAKVEVRFDNGGSYESFSYNDIFVFGNTFYRYSTYDQKIYNASNNNVIASLSYYYDNYIAGSGGSYDPSTNKYTLDSDPGNPITVNADKTFTYSTKTYKLLLSSLRFIEYKNVTSDWVDATTAPTTSTKTCGQQLMIKTFKNDVKSTTNDGASKTTDRGEIGFFDPQTMYIDCDPRTEFAYIKEDIFLINPIGDITLYMMFDIGHI